MNTRTRAAATTLAVLAALTLTISAPLTSTARIKGVDDPVAKVKDAPTVAVALVPPGQPPLPCLPGRYKCPLGGGTL